MSARDAWGQVAHNLRILADSIDAAIEPAAPPAVSDGVPTAPAARPEGVPPASSGQLPSRKPSESAFQKCPAHDRDWTNGKFGEFCTAASDDPDWSNDKGYCRVTRRSAGAWLRQHPRAAA